MAESTDPKVQDFESEWFEFATKVVNRIAKDPEIVSMWDLYKAGNKLSLEQRSQFIAVANRIKMEVMHETYGVDASESFETFKERWKHWYNHKGVVSTNQIGRRLTNEEHIVYSSTPEAEEFFINMEK